MTGFRVLIRTREAMAPRRSRLASRDSEQLVHQLTPSLSLGTEGPTRPILSGRLADMALAAKDLQVAERPRVATILQSPDVIHFELPGPPTLPATPTVTVQDTTPYQRPPTAVQTLMSAAHQPTRAERNPRRGGADATHRLYPTATAKIAAAAASSRAR